MVAVIMTAIARTRTHRQRDTHADRQTGRQTSRQTDTHVKLIVHVESHASVESLLENSAI